MSDDSAFGHVFLGTDFDGFSGAVDARPPKTSGAPPTTAPGPGKYAGFVPIETFGDLTLQKAAGVHAELQRIEPISNEFYRLADSIGSLRERFGGLTRVDVGEPGGEEQIDETTLERRIAAHLEKYASHAEINELLPDYFNGSRKFTRLEWNAIRLPGTPREISLGSIKQSITENETTALFGTSKALADDIRKIDRLRYALVVLRRRRQLALDTARRRLAKFDAAIPTAERELASRKSTRTEELGDYVVARRLVMEDWADVERRWAERRRILEENVGVYYVRVRETPVSVSLPDPLELRQAGLDDVVPGCSGEPGHLADELLPFLEAVFENPMADWTSLRHLEALLPARPRLVPLLEKARDRFSRAGARPLTFSASAMATRLAPLQREIQILSRPALQRVFPVTTPLRTLQTQAREALSLEDLLTGPHHGVRRPAQELHRRLSLAASCLVDRARRIRPSIRLDWAEDAEHGRLRVESPEHWPSLEKAEDDDFNGVRTLLELVHWWFRQLMPQCSATSRTAMRNFVRAALMHAAGDDPDRMVQGRVLTIPGRFRTGELLRLDLNREVEPGSVLQMLDATQRLIGTVRVNDHDDAGALAEFVQVFTSQPPDEDDDPISGGTALVADNFTVIGTPSTTLIPR